jgi:ATP-dependent DNA ligase
MPRVTPPSPRSGFIEPCLPSSAERPPAVPDWIHEIKHDGYRLMARGDHDIWIAALEAEDARYSRNGRFMGCAGGE